MCGQCFGNPNPHWTRYSGTLRMCPDQNLGKSGRAKEDLQPMGPPRKLLQYHWGRNYYILYLCRRFSATDSNSEEFQKPQPLLVSEKVRQYTLNLYGSTPPICTAILSWLLSFEERETPQYASHLYCSTPPICTAVRPPFVRQYFLEKYWGLGSPQRFSI